MSSPTTVQMPTEPCVVLSDGEVITVTTDRSCEQIRNFGTAVGPLGRRVMAEQLRAIADLLEPTPISLRATSKGASA